MKKIFKSNDKLYNFILIALGSICVLPTIFISMPVVNVLNIGLTAAIPAQFYFLLVSLFFVSLGSIPLFIIILLFMLKILKKLPIYYWVIFAVNIFALIFAILAWIELSKLKLSGMIW